MDLNIQTPESSRKLNFFFSNTNGESSQLLDDDYLYQRNNLVNPDFDNGFDDWTSPPADSTCKWDDNSFSMGQFSYHASPYCTETPLSSVATADSRDSSPMPYQNSLQYQSAAVSI